MVASPPTPSPLPSSLLVPSRALYSHPRSLERTAKCQLSSRQPSQSRPSQPASAERSIAAPGFRTAHRQQKQKKATLQRGIQVCPNKPINDYRRSMPPSQSRRRHSSWPGHMRAICTLSSSVHNAQFYTRLQYRFKPASLGIIGDMTFETVANA